LHRRNWDGVDELVDDGVIGPADDGVGELADDGADRDERKKGSRCRVDGQE